MVESLLTDEKYTTNIPIEDLTPSPFNTFPMDDIDDLAASIRRLGILEPLVVVGPDEEGKYEILGGERRYRAASLINQENTDAPPLSELPCAVVGGSDLDDILKQLLIEEDNTEVRHDTKWETHRFRLVMLYDQLVSEGKIASKEADEYIQKSLGISHRYAAMYRSINRNAIPELKNAVVSKNKDQNEELKTVHIPVDRAAIFSGLSPEEQQNVVDRINAGEDSKKIANEVQMAKRIKTEPKDLHPYTDSDFGYVHSDEEDSPSPQFSPTPDGRWTMQGEDDSLFGIPSRPDKTDYGSMDVEQDIDQMENILTAGGYLTPEESAHRDTSGRIKSLMNDDEVTETMKKRVIHPELVRLTKLSDRSHLSKRELDDILAAFSLCNSVMRQVLEDPGKSCMQPDDSAILAIISTSLGFVKDIQ